MSKPKLFAIVVIGIFFFLPLIANAQESCSGDCEFPLYAGQTDLVGCVTVSPVGSDLCVTYNMSEDWFLAETHAAISEDSDNFDGVVTKSGNPVPGKFPMKDEYYDDGELSTVTYCFPIDNSTGTVYIAAHAVVANAVLGEIETAWADGDHDFSGNNWATYIEHIIGNCVSEPPPGEEPPGEEPPGEEPAA